MSGQNQEHWKDDMGPKGRLATVHCPQYIPLTAIRNTVRDCPKHGGFWKIPWSLIVSAFKRGDYVPQVTGDEVKALEWILQLSPQIDSTGCSTHYREQNGDDVH